MKTAGSGMAPPHGVGHESGLTATERLSFAIDRWQETHVRLNALVQPRFDAAMREAKEVLVGDPRPLAGVPVSIKDCFAVAGLATTLGIVTRRAAVDHDDCSLVHRIRESGAVVVGKSNVPQALYLHETENPIYGRTNNPWSCGHGPGGSSGGDAAVVAAGVVPLAFGNDLAGSIRQPAHACGLVGYLPSSRCLGSCGSFNTMPWLKGLCSRAGVLARSVPDAVRAVEAVSGVRLTAANDCGPPLRIGWWDTAGPIPPSAAIVRGVHEAVSLLTDASIHTRRVDDSFAELVGWLHLGLVSSDGGASIRELLDGSPPIAQVHELLRIAGLPRWQRPLVAAIVGFFGREIESAALRRTGPRSSGQQAVLLRLRDALASSLERWRRAEKIDAVVCPVSALPALQHGTAGRLVLAAFPCLFASLMDLPAASLPVSRVRPGEAEHRLTSRDPLIRAASATDAASQGLPVGVQIVAVDGREETLIQVMTKLEHAVGWEETVRRLWK
jgi:fatty acid amide hydrolase